MQFNDVITEDWKDKVSEFGEIFGYIPENAFIVNMDSKGMKEAKNLDFVSGIGIYQPAYKINPMLMNKSGNINLTVVTFDSSDLDAISSNIQNLGGKILLKR